MDIPDPRKGWRRMVGKLIPEPAAPPRIGLHEYFRFRVELAALLDTPKARDIRRYHDVGNTILLGDNRHAVLSYAAYIPCEKAFNPGWAAFINYVRGSGIDMGLLRSKVQYDNIRQRHKHRENVVSLADRGENAEQVEIKKMCECDPVFTTYAAGQDLERKILLPQIEIALEPRAAEHQRDMGNDPAEHHAQRVLRLMVHPRENDGFDAWASGIAAELNDAMQKEQSRLNKEWHARYGGRERT